MAAAIDRIVVQIPPNEKLVLQHKARLMKIPLSELMRRGAQNYSANDADAELEPLIDRIIESTREAEAALDDALKFISESNYRIAAREGR